jgi:hypothetical protein
MRFRTQTLSRSICQRDIMRQCNTRRSKKEQPSAWKYVGVARVATRTSVYDDRRRWCEDHAGPRQDRLRKQGGAHSLESSRQGPTVNADPREAADLVDFDGGKQPIG